MTAQPRTTIAAVATPPGPGGIGVIRMSGPDSLAVVTRRFSPKNPAFAGFKPHRLHFGLFRDQDGAPLDEVLAAYMPGPKSYTGEDVVEISCHGGPAVLAAVLAALLQDGAEPAAPGEFTRRAFMNGRIDLSQAESVAEMISARSREGVVLAQAKLGGGLADKVRELRQKLEISRQNICLAVDFPEDEVECLDPDRFLLNLEQIAADISRLIENHERLSCFRQGGLAVLAGRVNAGKSSLLNRLLGWNRAIVAPLPGTTRDYLEETLNLGGLPLRLIDTAGLRKSGDPVELQGMDRARDLIHEADLCLLVLDASSSPLLGQRETELIAKLEPEKLLIILNKCDLLDQQTIHALTQDLTGHETIPLSAKTGRGTDALVQTIRDRLLKGKTGPQPGDLVPNLRQAQALKKALHEITQLIQDAQNQTPCDLLSVGLEAACARLADITGEIAPQDVLNAVFDSFCIGK